MFVWDVLGETFVTYDGKPMIRQKLHLQPPSHLKEKLEAQAEKTPLWVIQLERTLNEEYNAYMSEMLNYIHHN